MTTPRETRLEMTLRDATLIELLLTIATGSALFGFVSAVGGRVFSFTDSPGLFYPTSQLIASAIALVVCAALLLLVARRRPAVEPGAESDPVGDG